MKKSANYYIESLCDNKYFFAGLYTSIVLLYSAVSVQSYGYDDEFFNINLIEKLGFKTIGLLQQRDVHPPLSYIINAILFKIFNNWTAIRLASGLLNSCALILVINNQRRLFGNKNALVVFLLLALNPAILMWCTGIRWYAYFLPVLFYLVFQPVHNGYKAWAIALAAITLLGYLGYIVFLIFIPVLLLYWTLSDDTAKNKLRYLLYISPIFLVLYGYQLFVFFTVHLKNNKKEVSYSLMDNLRGYFISQISNQGVFPISAPALLSLAGCMGIFFCIIKYTLSGAKRRSSNVILAAYILAAILLVVSGVAGKPRNLIVLIPLQVFLIAHYYALLKNNKTYIASIILIGIANVCGCVNVFFHENTTKNSWNLPIKAAIAEIERVNRNDSSLIIFTHDPTLTYVLQRNKFNVVSWYNRKKITESGSIKTAIFVNTFRGSIKKPLYDSLISEEYRIHSSKNTVVKIGFDKYYRWKRKMAEEYPEYQIELIIYQNPENLKNLIFWNKKRI